MEIRIIEAEFNKENGTWKVTYAYELTGAQDHTENDQPGIGALDVLGGIIDITVTDASGDEATGTLQVEVHDDGPVLKYLETNNDGDENTTEEFTIALSGLHIGADMVHDDVHDDVQATVVVTVNGGDSYTFTVSADENGGYTFTKPDSTCPVEISGNEDDGYQLTYTRDEEDLKGSDAKQYTFEVTVKDADGDSKTQSVTIATTAAGSVVEKGVEGCKSPDDGSANTEAGANAEVSGTPSAEGTISLADAGTELIISGSVTHAHDSHLNDAEATTPTDSKVNTSLQLGGENSELTLYLNGNGELVETEPSDGYYGTLELSFSGTQEVTWTFTLNEEENGLANSLTEGESFDIALKLSTDPVDQSGSAQLHIHIQGTNDKPVFDVHCNAAGSIVVTDQEDEYLPDIKNSIIGKFEARDPDTDNGGGDDDQSINGLKFTVIQEEFTSNVGTVENEGDNTRYYNKDDQHFTNLVSDFKEFKQDSEGDRNYTQVETTYGYLKVYEDGDYEYKVKKNATDKIDEDEFVTETFTIRVQDAHGSWDTRTITITLRDPDNDIEAGKNLSQSLREEGVVGDDPALILEHENDPNQYVPQNDGTAMGENSEKDNVLFTEPDLNESVTLNLSGTVTVTQYGSTTSSTPSPSLNQKDDVEVGIAGTSTVLYLVATEDNGMWSFAWKESNEVGVSDDVVGQLTLTREEKSVDISYNFTLDPNDTNTTANPEKGASAFLDQLAQGDTVKIELDFSAGDDKTSSLTLTITGTNDKPVITGVVEIKPGENQNDNDGIFSLVTTEQFENEDDMDVEDGEYDLSGKVIASDVDRDNGAGSTVATEGSSEGTDNELVFTLRGMTSSAKDGIVKSEISEEYTANADGDYTTIETTYGTLTIDTATGAFHYTMHDPELEEDGKPNAIMALGKDETVEETYTVRVTDAHGSYSETQITITIEGTNDRPILDMQQNLEVHAAENDTPDNEYHTEEENPDRYSEAQAEATDPDKNDGDPTFCFVQDAEGAAPADTAQSQQSVDITAKAFLAALNNSESEVEFTSSEDTQASTLALLKGWLEAADENEVIATLHITEEGTLTLTLNEDSAFIKALNGEDSFRFKLSDVSDFQVYAKDDALYSAHGEDVTLVIHGQTDAYVVSSGSTPHVKESGVYRPENQTEDSDGGNTPTKAPGTDYGQHAMDFGDGRFTIAGCDAGQVVFTTEDGIEYNETGTTISKGTDGTPVEVTFKEGDSEQEYMYVLGKYGYYQIDLSSTMDADGTRTFEYSYHLFSEQTPEDVTKLLTEEVFADKLANVDSLPQGVNVTDDVEITITVGQEKLDNTLTLSATVSGTNDKPVITGVETVNGESGTGEVLEKSQSQEQFYAAQDSSMFYDEGGENEKPTLHIKIFCDEGDTFIGRITGNDPDGGPDGEEGGLKGPGIEVVNYSFVLNGVSSQVWTLQGEDGQTITSEFGTISIGKDGTFTVHIDQEAVKALGDGAQQNIFQGIGVQCTDELGATSEVVKLEGTLHGKDDAAYVVSHKQDELWESKQSKHDDSVIVEEPEGEKTGYVEGGTKTMLTGTITVTDPDTSDTFANTVTVTVGENTYIVEFDDSGNMTSVTKERDEESSATEPLSVPGANGTFTFTLEINSGDETQKPEAILEYTYTVTNNDAKGDINGLNDGETYFSKYGSNLENIEVSFSSGPEGTEDNTSWSSTPVSITVDVHGRNDAPEISVNTDTENGPTKDENGDYYVHKDIPWQGTASGSVSASDPDDDLPTKPEEEETTDPDTSDTSGTDPEQPDGSETSSAQGEHLQFGFLVYTDSEGKEHVVRAEVDETSGITQYYYTEEGKGDGPITEDDKPITLDSPSLTFTNQVKLDHGSIHINDYGEYTYHRDPYDDGKEDDSVYITVMDPQGAMDSVQIKFELDEVGGGGPLPTVEISGVTIPGLTEPSDSGDRVVVGEEDAVASSFDEGVEGIKVTVTCIQKNGKYIPVQKQDDGTYVDSTGKKVELEDGGLVTEIYGQLVDDDGDGKYSWKYYTQDDTPLDTTQLPATPNLDFYLMDGNEQTYSLSTEYGTVYVDGETGELRFELNNKADELNAGEEWTDTIRLYVNSDSTYQEVKLKVTGTGDASEVEVGNVVVDLDPAGTDEDQDDVVSDATPIVIDDIDNRDGMDGEAYDTHTLEINIAKEGENDNWISVDTSESGSAEIKIYVMKEGENGYSYTQDQPASDAMDNCYGYLTLTKDENGYSYTFTAWPETTVSKQIKPNDHLDFTFNIQVTDTAYQAGSPVEGDNNTTTTSASFTVTLEGKADAVTITGEKKLYINEEGAVGTEDSSGNVSFEQSPNDSLSVEGNLGVVDYDDAGYTVTGKHIGAEEETQYSSVVKGQYGTLILNNDGTYSYVLDYDKCQSLKQGTSEKDTFTVQVSNGVGDPVETTVTINIHGVNDLPVVTVTPVLAVQEGSSNGNDTGKVEAQDVDGDTLSYVISGADTDSNVSVSTAEGNSATVYVVGTWNDETGKMELSLSKTQDVDNLVGTLTIDEEGNYIFNVADTDTARSLNGGASASITVNIGASDGHGDVTRPVTIIVHGTNQDPEVNAELTASESKVTDEVTDADNQYSITFTPSEESENDYTVTDADRDDELSYTFAQDGRYFTSTEAQLKVNDTQYSVTLEIDPDNGTITMHYNDAVKNAIDALATDETAELVLPKDFQLVVQDSFGGITSENLSLTITGENDPVEIADKIQEDIPITDTGTGSEATPGTGTFTFTDVDSSDTHDVTLPQTVQVWLGDEDKDPYTASVSNDGEVTLTPDGESEGIVLGTLTAQVTTPANGETGTVTYSFAPDPDYLSGLGKGETVRIEAELTVTDREEGEGTTDTATVSFELEGKNDAVQIIGEPSMTPDSDEKGSYSGSITFSDADLRDSHTVTFKDLYTDDDKTPLQVNCADLSSEQYAVYTEGGLKLGSMSLTLTDDENGEQTLSYTFTPVTNDEDLNQLPVGENEYSFSIIVGDGHTGGSASSQQMTITVDNPNDTPSISVTPNEDDARTGTLTITDADVQDTHTLSVTYKDNPYLVEENGKVEIPGVGTFTFTQNGENNRSWDYIFDPETDKFPASKSTQLEFTFSVTENRGGGSTSEPASVKIEVTGTNTAPDSTCADTLNIATWDTGATVTLPETDNDGDTLIYSFAGSDQTSVEGTYGTLTWDEAGQYTYTLNTEAKEKIAQDLETAEDNQLTETFGYTVKDGVHELHGTLTLTLDLEALGLATDTDTGEGEGGTQPDVTIPDSDTDSDADQPGQTGQDADGAGDGNASANTVFLRTSSFDEMLDNIENGDSPVAAFSLLSDGSPAAETAQSAASADLILYDASAYLVSGNAEHSFMVSNEPLTLEELLQGNGENSPIVEGIDVLITGEGAASLTSSSELAEQLGISMSGDSLTLDQRWEKVSSASGDTQAFSNGTLTLETSREVSQQSSDDMSLQVAMQQVTQGN